MPLPAVTCRYLKAWFRRGLSLLAIGEFNEAAADLEVAKRLEPADRSILAARTQAHTVP
jgi:predicted TPR repeat methyltransferase